MAHALLVPLVGLDVNVGNASRSKSGIGDLDITALALSYRHNANLQSDLGLDIMAPSGRYNKTYLANIGWAQLLSNSISLCRQ